ncbi:hypothetical protein L1887_16460 [Cichorium endivia]|nr:hypothetical protein L1887_16460 [Cichorium endivia]
MLRTYLRHTPATSPDWPLPLHLLFSISASSSLKLLCLLASSLSHTSITRPEAPKPERMETEESRLNSEIKGKVVQIFSHFMARVAKLEELTSAGNRFLDIFRQGLDFIHRPSIDNTSQLFEKVIKANNTDRMQSYIKAGYTHTFDRAENLNKLHTSHIQLLDISSKGKNIIKELECLVEDLKLAIESANETLQDLVPEKPEVVDYATMVAVIYSMVKKDYVMQEKIVSTLNLKTTSGELETYCLMWSLRPFVNDEIMHQAWRLIP